jgi:hypothetical protein
MVEHAMNTNLSPLSSPNAVSPTYFTVGMALLILALTAVFVLVVQRMTGGYFGYTLDDPYIHLALSEGIANAHYGLNGNEVASPSSSILYPLLLAIGVPFAWHVFLPLILNVAATLLLMGVLAQMLHRAGYLQTRRGVVFSVLLALILLFGVHVFGVIFCGLEHSLHLAVSTLLLWGLIQALYTQRLHGWFLAAIVLTPLLRFEGLAASVPTLLLLLLWGQYRAALIAGALLAAALLAYGTAMHQIGLPFLPSSVSTKLEITQYNGVLGTLMRLLATAQDAFNVNPASHLAACLVLLPFVHALLKLAPRTAHQQADYGLAFLAASMVAGHALLGKWGWGARYEVYLLVTLLLLNVWVWRVELTRLLAGKAPQQVMALVVLPLFVLSAAVPYVSSLIPTYKGSDAIYRQQYQMHRFATEFYQKPVAINDLGWVSYRNDHYVLDLWGLGSEEARTKRMATTKDDTRWMNPLMEKHDVRLAMIYDVWFPYLPENWMKVASLELTPKGTAYKAYAAESTVAFYVTSCQEAKAVQPALRAFAASLPNGAALERHGEILAKRCR